MTTAEESKTQHITEVIPSIETRAIELRFEGYPYSEIHKKLKTEYPDETVPHFATIRAWFAPNGKLKDLYVDYAKREGDERHKHTQDIFKAHVTTAIQTLVLSLSSPSHMVRVLAAKEILNRQLGEPVKPVLNISEDKVIDYLETAKRLRNEKIQGNVGSGEVVSAGASV